MHRGEIYWVDLREPTGSEPGRRRPVLVVSSDRFNQSRIETVVAVAITSNLRLAAAPGNVELPSDATGLDRDSVANVSQIVTVDKALLSDWVGRIDPATMRLIDAGMGLALDLPTSSP
ncbi:MAG: type II toxin-antitoxin system PemK/MazF family toxin [Acidimicrobiia bacterium]|nr:type II toxin-antitoxin system PemK/MazF family toxin [Acidimicrobiia bacterium]